MEIKPCEACKKRVGNQWHHKFPQGTEKGWRRKLYGALLDDPRNLQWCCEKCNPSHAGLGLIHWSEEEFCKVLNIEIRSKTGKVRAL